MIALIDEIPAKRARPLSESARKRPPLHREGVDSGTVVVEIRDSTVGRRATLYAAREPE
jgi:hypothetical protein